MNILNNEKNTGSMHEVTIEKAKLLEILKDNKARHDAVLEVARKGYLEAAKKVLFEKNRLFHKYLKELRRDFKYSLSKLEKRVVAGENLENDARIAIKTQFDTLLNLQYPEDHTKDYDRAIRMVELSVHDKVTLQLAEFESYVLNNWDWSDKFLTLNSAYVSYTPMSGGYSNSLANTVAKEGATKVFKRS